MQFIGIIRMNNNDYNWSYYKKNHSVLMTQL
jgi:hypothetical protein